MLILVGKERVRVLRVLRVVVMLQRAGTRLGVV